MFYHNGVVRQKQQAKYKCPLSEWFLLSCMYVPTNIQRKIDNIEEHLYTSAI